MNRQHIGTREPGTRAAYKMDLCRCYPCSHAASVYEADRTQRIADGTWQPLVSSAPIRAHLLYLRANGIGLRCVEEITGVKRRTLQMVLDVRSGSPKRKQVRTETADAILRVRPGIDTARDGALIDATGTVRRVHALVALGYPKAYLAKRLGRNLGYLAALTTYPHVVAARARAVRDLYDELSMRKPEELGLLKGSITRARNHGAYRGWPKPLNWDDDEIDNPDAQPHYGKPAPGEKPMKRSAALLEDAQFIIANTPVDLAERRDRDRVAEQLGIGIDYLDRLLKQAA